MFRVYYILSKFEDIDRHLLAQVCELSQPARVIGHGAVGVGGEGDAEGREHSHG